MAKRNGSGSIYLRGKIWWVQVYVNGHPIIRSTKCEKLGDAKKFRDDLLGVKTKGKVGGSTDKILIGELLDDVLKSDIAESTRKIWRMVVDKNLRPYFGTRKASLLTTDMMDAYRKKRTGEGRTDATVNRELSILRTAFHNARKRTPPKVHIVPHFPMIEETTIREGFLEDDEYAKLREAMPEYLRPLFVTGYMTGVRKGELLGIKWPAVDFESGLMAIGKTKNGKPRTVPIIDGDMRDFLLAAKEERDEQWPKSPWVFNRQGEQILDFRGAWDKACELAGVPDLTFHDLRRTAVRNMRRAGVPQVVRMKISGHKTDSMERRYNIVDTEDLEVAKQFMAARTRVNAVS